MDAPATFGRTMLWLIFSVFGGAFALLGALLLAWLGALPLGIFFAALGLWGAVLSGGSAPIRDGVGVVTAPLAWCAPALIGVGVASANGSSASFGVCLGLAMVWWLAGSASAVHALLRRHAAQAGAAPSFDHTPEHLCMSCGYDLRGLPSGAVCPECGAAKDTSPAGASIADA